MFGRRADATLVRDLDPVRRFMQFVSPRRNESLVYFEQELDVEAALRFAEERSAQRAPERPLTLFHVLLAGIGRTFHERPRINRFTAGGGVWQRDGVWLTFSAKMRLEDGAPVLTMKRPFDPSLGLDAFVDGLHDSLSRGRRGEKSTSDKEVGLLLRLPAFLTRAIMGLVDATDGFGLLPKAMIEPDPMFSSVFVANLGSVGLDAAYHHLWEHGTCPFFCVIGRVEENAEGRRSVRLKWSFDERVEDGMGCARCLDLLAEYVSHPEKLLDGA
jgi:hypothetical protein